jgi:hypothetical protein
MGREIRRVPPGWQHPTCAEVEPTKRHREPDRHHPLFDQDFLSAAIQWKLDLAAWDRGDNPDRDEYCRDDGSPYEYWEWGGGPPDRNYYRSRAWSAEEATAYQVYENVSEGTPISPVLETVGALYKWLVNEQGLSSAAAEQFIESGYVPSGIITVNAGKVGVKMNFETLE